MNTRHSTFNRRSREYNSNKKNKSREYNSNKKNKSRELKSEFRKFNRDLYKFNRRSREYNFNKQHKSPELRSAFRRYNKDYEKYQRELRKRQYQKYGARYFMANVGDEDVREDEGGGEDVIDQLIEAAEGGDIQEVRILITGGAHVHAANRALMTAAENGHTEIVQALIRAGADVDAAESNGYTSLMLAANNGHTEIAQELIRAGADVDAAVSNGMTALMEAVENNHTEIVRALIDGGADVNYTDNEGYTALRLAAEHGHRDIVQALIDGGATVDDRIRPRGGDTEEDIDAIHGYIEEPISQIYATYSSPHIIEVKNVTTRPDQKETGYYYFNGEKNDEKFVLYPVIRDGNEYKISTSNNYTVNGNIQATRFSEPYPYNMDQIRQDNAREALNTLMNHLLNPSPENEMNRISEYNTEG